MLQFLLKRFIQAIVVMLIISLLSFSIKDKLGDPLREMTGQSVSQAERDIMREEMGLNDPFFVQYFRFIKDAAQGDLGTSYFHKLPAMTVILKKLPATLELTFGATLIIIFLSIPLGVFSAINPKHWFSKFIMAVSIVGISIPVVLTALALIYIFQSNSVGCLPLAEEKPFTCLDIGKRTSSVKTASCTSSCQQLLCHPLCCLYLSVWLGLKCWKF